MTTTGPLDAVQFLPSADGWRAAPGPKKTIDRIVAEQAQATPDAIAIIDGDVETSYRALIERAGEIVGVLRDRNVAPGERVGLCADPSVDFFATMIAIFAMGATYVPLDPMVPKPRLDHMVSDAALSLVLVSRSYAERFDASLAFVLDGLAPASSTPFASIARPRDVAYIIYTSGSTGAPKGVEIRHDGLTNAILAANERCEFVASDREGYRTSIGFDAALLETFGPLAAGAAIVIAPRHAWADSRAFTAFILAHGITSIVLTAGFLAVLLDDPNFQRCTSLRVVSCGGEALSIGVLMRFFEASRATLWNCYGPSETTIFVLSHKCELADVTTSDESAPLGKPLTNVYVSVRDAALLPVGPGSTGEIVVGGVQVGNGYINNPAATDARFVADPTRPGERLYRTGDLVRLREDGAIIFLGRNDKQVKIRGQRVEPAEIAAAIERLHGVRTAVVLPRQRHTTGSDSSLCLVAYVAAQTGATLVPAVLRHALRGQLPAAMVPAEIVVVETFPLSITGKIDEIALAEREQNAVRPVHASVPADHTSLRGILHEQLRTMWESLLEIDGIGDHDDFYDLGGDSLLAVTLLTRIEEIFGRSVTFAEFFNAMTIAGLGDVLTNEAELAERDAVMFNEAGTLPPLVFLHGDFAGGMYAWALPGMLGDDQPLLVIPPHGMRGRPPATSVPDMAADVVATIERFSPAGPVRIAGYSAAGLVAYEAARRLRDAGRPVLEVVIIGMGAENVAFAPLDTIARGLRLPARLRDAVLRRAMRAGYRIERLARLPRAERWPKIVAVLRRSRQPAPPAHTQTIETIETSAAYARYCEAHESYVPRRYDGPVTILWPREQPVENGDVRRDWSRVAPLLEIVPVSGSHHAAVSRYLGEIAVALRAGSRGG